MSSAIATLTCACGHSITVKLRPGPGNDPSIEVPDDWRMWFQGDDVIAECPACAQT